MQEEIKKLRVNIDAIAQLTIGLQPHKAMYAEAGINAGQGVDFNTKEINKCVDALYMGKAWLGKVMGELGVASPYKSSGHKTKEDIDPTADVAKNTEEFPLAPENWEEGDVTKSHIEKVDYLRNEIEKCVQTIKSVAIPQGSSRELAIARTNSYTYLCEARFHLGFEFQRIKEGK